MKPFKIKIKVDATEHYVYKGRLYVVLSDGGIISVSIYEIIETLISKYPQFEPLIKLGFRRNNFWNSEAAKCFLSIPKVRKALMSEWNKAADTIVFEISIDELSTTTVCREVETDVLSIDMYADRLFIGCRKGFYSKGINDNIFIDNSLKKRFDSKIYSLGAGYGNIILSLGRHGFIPADGLSDKMVDERLLRQTQSMQSRWTAAGGLMNYSDKKNFNFFGNYIAKNNQSAEGYVITEFGVNKYSIEKLLSNQKVIEQKSIILSFNNRDIQYFISSDHSILSSKLNVSKGEISRLAPCKMNERINTRQLGKLISGDTLANHVILEFEDGLVLLDKKSKLLIEEDSIVNYHTYPRSKYFRDILTVTTEDSVNIHAIDVFDVDPTTVFPNADKRFQSHQLL